MPTLLRHCGFETWTNYSNLDGGIGNKNPRSITGRFSFGAVRNSASGIADSQTYSGVTTDHGGNTRRFTARVKVRADELPSGGNNIVKLLGVKHARQGFDVLVLCANDSGELLVYEMTSGTTGSLVHTQTGVFTVGETVLIEVMLQLNTISSQPIPNPPYDSDGVAAVRVNGSTVWSDAQSTVNDINGWRDYISTSWTAMTLGCEAVTGIFTATRAAFSFDDWAAAVPSGLSDWLGTGYSCMVTPIDYGANSGWGIDDTSLEYLCRDAVNGQGIDSGSLTSTTALDTVTVLCPTLTDVGIPGSANIRQVSIFALGTGSQAAMRAVLVVNGTTYYSDAAVLGTTQSYREYIFSGVSLLAGDTIEIGIEKDNTTTSRKLNHLMLSVEVDTIRESRLSRDVAVKVGGFTGNGTVQEILLDFEPTFLFITPTASSGESYMKCVSAKGWWLPAFRYDTGFIGSDHYVRVNTTRDGIIVGPGVWNSSGVAYAVLAIRDPAFRLMQMSAERTGGRDDSVLPWVGELPVQPDMCFVATPTQSNLDTWSRWPFHSGDQSKRSDSGTDALAAEANIIQAVDNVGVTLGSGIGSTAYAHVIGFNDAIFYTSQLVAVASYVGDGTSSRTLGLPTGMALKTPSMIWLTPDATRMTALPANSTDYDCIATSAHATGRCNELRNGNLKSAGVGITALGVGSFTVSAAYNVSGVTYNVLVFADGDDIEPITDSEWPDSPNEEEMPRNPPEPPTEWILTWPDDSPGLLGIVMRANKYEPPPEPQDGRVYYVVCEQRTFPVADHVSEIPVSYETREFDALEEY